MAELSKSTVLSGTGDLTGLGIVYVYNTNTFSDDLITSGLYYDSRKINPEIIEILANPERKNIRDIYELDENNEAKRTTEGTEGYYDLLNILEIYINI